MKSSAKNSVSSELRDLDKLSRGTRSYFQQRQRNRLHNLVLSKFAAAEASQGLTRAKLARRMGRAPEIITRLLRSPGNWRLDTLSDLLLAISGEEIDDTAISPLSRPTRNFYPHANQEIQIPITVTTLKNGDISGTGIYDINKMLEPAS